MLPPTQCSTAVANHMPHAACHMQDDKYVVMVQEYCSRGDLFDFVRGVGGRMAEPDVRDLVVAPLLDVLHYLHGHAIVHRDIKPGGWEPAWQPMASNARGAYACTQAVAVTALSASSWLLPQLFCTTDMLCPATFTPWLFGVAENLLIATNGDLKLGDFGVAIDLSKERAVTQTGWVGGGGWPAGWLGPRGRAWGAGCRVGGCS